MHVFQISYSTKSHTPNTVKISYSFNQLQHNVVLHPIVVKPDPKPVSKVKDYLQSRKKCKRFVIGQTVAIVLIHKLIKGKNHTLQDKRIRCCDSNGRELWMSIPVIILLLCFIHKSLE